jgi:hypothetical protein
MKRKVAVLLSMLSIVAYSQNPNGWDTAWVTSFGGPSIDKGRDIKETSDKGFIIIGTTSSFGGGNTSFYVIKTDSLGTHKWSTSVGTNQNDIAASVEIATDGGFFFSGSSNWNTQTGYDGYLVKTDNLGNVQWSKNYGGDDWDFFYNSCMMPDGGLLLCGESYSQSKGGTDSYLVRIDSNGDTLWTRRYGTSEDDAFYSVAQKNNAIYVVGKIYDAVNDKTSASIYKIDFNGNVINQNIYQGYISENTVYNDLFITGSNDILLCGKHSSTVTENYILRKVDPVNFGEIFNTSSPLEIEMNCVIEGNNNDVYILGTNFGTSGLGGSSAVYYRFDQGFSYLQGANFGGTKQETGYEMIRTSKGGYALVGSTTSYGNQNGSDDENVYLVVFNKPNLLNDYFLVLTEFLDPLSPVSIKKQTIVNQTSIYPNPVTTSYRINFANDDLIGQTLSYQLFDFQGRLINEKKIQATYNGIELNREDLNPGVYFYKLSSNSGHISTGKISFD